MRSRRDRDISRRMDAKQILRDKIEEERRTKLLKENLIANMEMEELELISRL